MRGRSGLLDNHPDPVERLVTCAAADVHKFHRPWREVTAELALRHVRPDCAAKATVVTAYELVCEFRPAVVRRHYHDPSRARGPRFDQGRDASKVQISLLATGAVPGW